MNKHEIFAKVKAHLLKQGMRSMNAGSFCAYRGAGGLSCAVGCLIPDAEYDPIIENLPANDFRVQERLPFEVTEETGHLLCELQRVHDCSAPSAWPMVLGDVAFNFSIEEQS